MKKHKSGTLGLLYVSPWLLGLLAFRLYPFVYSLLCSFTDFRLFDAETEFVGLDNYKLIFTDEKIISSLGRTFLYVLLTVPLKLAVSLAVACLLCRSLRGIGLFRTAFYIPSLLGGSVAVSVLWKALFRDGGPVSFMAELFGLPSQSWLGDYSQALMVIVLLRVWQFGSSMIIFLAALKAVPRELYESASLDGAGRLRSFVRITLPMISPVMLYNLVMQLAEVFQEFNAPYIVTQGGPRGSTTFFSLLIYKKAFRENELGMASAMAWILFLIVSVFCTVAFLSRRKWVFYRD